ncbi:hypothetical protein B0T21DRAFT_412516 [Apiosordaria backusii]|uniref:Uncharacterized protein n=1 Tax=Apiosordaria backusii TaxID=314023 RepID=A0AA40EBN6_9PEZI|nr:hypothetical protein B0T21DRAFT_412516 [Apiosordaria backusii]
MFQRDMKLLACAIQYTVFVATDDRGPGWELDLPVDDLLSLDDFVAFAPDDVLYAADDEEPSNDEEPPDDEYDLFDEEQDKAADHTLYSAYMPSEDVHMPSGDVQTATNNVYMPAEAPVLYTQGLKPLPSTQGPEPLPSTQSPESALYTQVPKGLLNTDDLDLEETLGLVNFLKRTRTVYEPVDLESPLPNEGAGVPEDEESEDLNSSGKLLLKPTRALAPADAARKNLMPVVTQDRIEETVRMVVKIYLNVQQEPSFQQLMESPIMNATLWNLKYRLTALFALSGPGASSADLVCCLLGQHGLLKWPGTDKEFESKRLVEYLTSNFVGAFDDPATGGHVLVDFASPHFICMSVKICQDRVDFYRKLWQFALQSVNKKVSCFHCIAAVKLRYNHDGVDKIRLFWPDGHTYYPEGAPTAPATDDWEVGEQGCYLLVYVEVFPPVFSRPCVVSTDQSRFASLIGNRDLAGVGPCLLYTSIAANPKPPAANLNEDLLKYKTLNEKGDFEYTKEDIKQLKKDVN